MFLVFISQHTKLVTEHLDNHTEWTNNSMKKIFLRYMYVWLYIGLAYTA